MEWRIFHFLRTAHSRGELGDYGCFVDVAALSDDQKTRRGMVSRKIAFGGGKRLI